MSRATYVSILRNDAAGLLDAAAGGLDAAVPSCPGWDVERLVGHVGRVWRRVTLRIVAGAGGPAGDGTIEQAPPGPAVLDWARAGLDPLVAALESAPDDLVATAAAPPVPPGEGPGLGLRPPLFWARRMALETATHRWDAQMAVGTAAPQPVDAELAVAGIDEALDVLLPERLPDALPGDGETLHLHATDAEGEWLVTLTPGLPRVERAHAKGDVAARGTASDLYLFLWNRVPADRLQVFGDDALLGRWTAAVHF